MENQLLNATKHRVKYWWLSLIVGLLAIAVGIMSSIQPIATLSILTILFIANFLVSGSIEIIFAFTNRESIKNWGWILASGIISLLFAILLLAMPAESILVFIFYIGFSVMLQSMTGIQLSFDLKEQGVKDWGLLLALALLGILLSLILIFKPTFAIGFITILFSITMVCYGMFKVYISIKLKKAKDFFEENQI